MPQTDQRRRLIDLFRETGPAHHRAYIAARGTIAANQGKGDQGR